VDGCSGSAEVQAMSDAFSFETATVRGCIVRLWKDAGHWVAAHVARDRAVAEPHAVIYCPTQMWFDNPCPSTTSAEQIIQWVADTEDGKLLRMVQEKPLQLVFVIPTAAEVDLQFLERCIGNCFQGSEHACQTASAFGSSAGGWLVLHLMARLPYVKSAVSVSPAPPTQASWNRWASDAEDFKHSFSRKRCHVKIITGSRELDIKEHLRPLDGHPGVEIEMLDKGHIGAMGRDCWERIYAMIDNARELKRENPEAPAEKWSCSRCTFDNPGKSSVCDMCNEPRDALPVGLWACLKCTLHNEDGDIFCRACNTRRVDASSSSSAVWSTRRPSVSVSGSRNQPVPPWREAKRDVAPAKDRSGPARRKDLETQHAELRKNLPPIPPKAPAKAEAQANGGLRSVGQVVALHKDDLGGTIRDEKDNMFEFDWYGTLDGRPRIGEKVKFSWVFPASNRAFDICRVDAIQQAMPVYRVSESEVMKAQEFLKRHACRTLDEKYSHSSMAGTRDFFASGTGRFNFPDDDKSKQQLAQSITAMHRHNHEHGSKHKLYLTEHPSDVYAFVEDIDIVGEINNGTPEVMRQPDGRYDYELLKWRATALRKIFPSADMRCVLFEASGLYTGSGHFKESYHLVWPSILTNKARAKLAREKTVEYLDSFADDSDHPVTILRKKCKICHDFNDWDKVFDATTTRPTVGLRMPYCDKRSKKADGSWTDEERRVVPVAELAFDFEGGLCTRVVQMAGRDDKTPAEWVQRGMCRRGETAQMAYFGYPEPLPDDARRRQRPGPRTTGSGGPGRGPGSGGPGRGPGGPPPKGGGRGGSPTGHGGKGQGRRWSSSGDDPSNKRHALDRGGRPFYGGSSSSSWGSNWSSSRAFDGNTEAFIACLRQHAGGQTFQTDDIQGGIQARFGVKGVINFFPQTKAVLIQGKGMNDLIPLVGPFTTAR